MEGLMYQFQHGLALLSLFIALPAASADVLTTTYASNGGQFGNMFDVNVLSSNGIAVEQFGLNLDVGTWDLEIYSLNSPYGGNETNPGAWTLRDAVFGLVSTAANAPTIWDFADFELTGGSISAIYVTVTNGPGINYTNGSLEGAVFASDSNIEILEGTGNSYPFGFAFRPRVWNGDFHYRVTAIPEPSAMCGLMFLCVALVLRKRMIDD